MEYKEQREIATKLRNPEDMLAVLQDFLNMGGDTSMSLFIRKEGSWSERQTGQRPADWHPTLQQCLMRGFIVPLIKSLADIEYTDDRNRGTVRMCKKILPILSDESLPFI